MTTRATRDEPDGCRIRRVRGREVNGMRKMAAALLMAASVVVGGGVPASAGGGCHSETSTEGTGTKVVMKDACFGPSVLRVPVGQTVTWTNLDAMDHVVGGTGWGTYGDLAKGDSVSQRFTEAGVYAYSCHLHPGMNGVVLVGDVSKGGSNGAAVQYVLPPPPAAGAGEESAAGTSETAVSGTTTEPAQAVSTGVGPGWRVAAFVGFGLFVLAGGWLVLERIGRRRAAAVEM
jgi:plastocyanin